MFALVLAHINNFQDICCRKQAGFFSFDDKNLQTRLKLVSEHDLFYGSSSMSESQQGREKFVTSLVQQ